MSQSRVTALGIATIAFVVTLVIFVLADIFGVVDIHMDVINTLVGFASAGCICYVAAYIDQRQADRSNGITLQVAELHIAVLGCIEGQTELRVAVAQCADGMTEYGDSRVAEDRIAALRNLAPHVNGTAAPRFRAVSP